MKIKKKETYAQFIKRVRNAVKLTQKDFAAELGYCEVSVCRWENGAKVPEFTQRIIDEYAKDIK